MKIDSLPLEHDSGLSFQDRIDILFHEIELAVRWGRPSILFAIYKSDFIRDEVDSLLKEKLGKIAQKTHSIKTNQENQFDFLAQISQLPDLSQTVLLIDVFNCERETDSARVFKEFNKNREYFIDNNIRAIFWLYENEVSDFATNATECWILRHRVVEFLDIPQPGKGLIQSQESLMEKAENPPADKNPSGASPEKINIQDKEKVNPSHVNALLNLGLLFLKKGDLQNALKYVHASTELSLLIASQSLEAKCQNVLAQVLTKLGNIDGAVSAYQRAISLTPEAGILWNSLGQLLSENQRDEEAKSAFKEAVSCSPGDYLGWDGAGHVHIRLGEYQEAIFAFEKALEINPNSESAWVGIAKAHLESGQLEKAEGSLRKALELNVHLINAWMGLGKCFSQQERNPDAIAVYHRALEFNPQNADLWDELERLHFQSERKEFGDKNNELTAEIYAVHVDNKRTNEPDIPGKEIGEKMIEANHLLDLKTAAEWNAYGNTHFRSGDYNDAIVAYTKAIELAPEICWPYIQNLANVHYQKGKEKGKLVVGKVEDPDIWEGEAGSDSPSLFSFDAISTPGRNDTFETPRLEKPNNNYPGGQLPGNTQSGKPHSDNPDLVEYSSGDKKGADLETDDGLLNALISTGKKITEVPIGMETAVRFPVEAQTAPACIETCPQTASGWNELGNSYTSFRKYDNAIEAYEKAIELDPKAGQPYSNLGFIYYHMGKYELSIQLYSRSIELLDTPRDKALSWNRIGDAYRRLGDYENAMTAYQKSSEIGPVMNPVAARPRSTIMQSIVAG